MSLEDAAQDHEAKIWLLNNRTREVKKFAPGAPGYGPQDCVQCGDDMPEPRRAHGFGRCVPCVQKTEAPRRR